MKERAQAAPFLWLAGGLRKVCRAIGQSRFSLQSFTGIKKAAFPAKAAWISAWRAVL
jgi:hypothetical protein